MMYLELNPKIKK